MQSVSTIGKTDVDYVFPNYEQARMESTWKEDIENLAQFDNSVMLVDEFLIDTYDWDFITEILDAINDAGIPSGIITSFPFKTSGELIDSPILEDKSLFDFYMIPVNKLGYMMDVPDFRSDKQEELKGMLDKIDKKDPFKNQDLVYTIDGVRGRHIDVYRDKVVITTKVTLGSILTSNATDGEKTIYYSDCIGVQFKKSKFTIGYLQLETASTNGNNICSNFFAENSLNA